MAEHENIYRRLPGRGGFVFYKSRLWQGRDHLLLVNSTGVTESYKRLYFRDIQAIVVQRTQTGKIWNYVFAGIIFILLIPVAAGTFGMIWSGGRDWSAAVSAAFVICSIFFVFFLVLLLMNFLRGATCIVHVKTAVQTAPLPSVTRLRTARKVIERIKPAIDGAQAVTTSPAAETAAVS
jgi:hypothetical protein